MSCLFQLWYAHRPLDDDHMRNRAYSQSDVQDSIAPETMKLNVGISSNGDVDVGEISLAEMDPEDIRVGIIDNKENCTRGITSILEELNKEVFRLQIKFQNSTQCFCHF